MIKFWLKTMNIVNRFLFIIISEAPMALQTNNSQAGVLHLTVGISFDNWCLLKGALSTCGGCFHSMFLLFTIILDLLLISSHVQLCLYLIHCIINDNVTLWYGQNFILHLFIMLIYLNNMVCLCVYVVCVCVKVCLCMLGKQKLILSVFKAYKIVEFILFSISLILVILFCCSSDLLFHLLPSEVFLNLTTPPSTFMSNTPHLLRYHLLTSLSNDVFISVRLTQRSKLKTLSSFTVIKGLCSRSWFACEI